MKKGKRAWKETKEEEEELKKVIDEKRLDC
jgi:hypothetical protein